MNESHTRFTDDAHGDAHRASLRGDCGAGLLNCVKRVCARVIKKRQNEILLGNSEPL